MVEISVTLDTISRCGYHISHMMLIVLILNVYPKLKAFVFVSSPNLEKTASYPLIIRHLYDIVEQYTRGHKSYHISH